MRLLLVGDVVGKPGRQIVVRAMPGLRIEQELDLVVVNAENAAGGSGLTPAIYQELISAGVDCITMGDHIYRRREIFPILHAEARIVRPANYPPEAPGRPFTVITRPKQRPRGRDQSARAASSCRRSTARCTPPIACWRRSPPDVRVILVDFHAEATSDKQVMGRYLDGRVTAVLGTHTHVPTADEQILPGGTAFQCDVGMTGPHESILGRQIDRVLETVHTFRPTHFEVATGDPRMHGTIVDADPATGRASAIRRVVVDEAEAERLYQRAKGVDGSR